MKHDLASKLLRSGEISRRDFAAKTASSLLGVGLLGNSLASKSFTVTGGCASVIFDLFRIGERGEIVTTEGGPLSELDPSTSYIDSVRSINVQSSVAFFFEEG